MELSRANIKWPVPPQLRTSVKNGQNMVNQANLMNYLKTEETEIESDFEFEE
jgi:hypothetical protein